MNLVDTLSREIAKEVAARVFNAKKSELLDLGIEEKYIGDDVGFDSVDDAVNFISGVVERKIQGLYYKGKEDGMVLMALKMQGRGWE